jgi:hypothetical protein
MPLAAHMLGLSNSAERQRSRFRLYSDLVDRTPLVRLTASPHDRPADLADLVEEALARAAEPISGTVA